MGEKFDWKKGREFPWKAGFERDGDITVPEGALGKPIDPTKSKKEEKARKLAEAGILEVPQKEKGL